MSSHILLDDALHAYSLYATPCPITTHSAIFTCRTHTLAHSRLLAGDGGAVHGPGELDRRRGCHHMLPAGRGAPPSARVRGGDAQRYT